MNRCADVSATGRINNLMDHHFHCGPRSLSMQLLSPVTHVVFHLAGRAVGVLRYGNTRSWSKLSSSGWAPHLSLQGLPACQALQLLIQTFQHSRPSLKFHPASPYRLHCIHLTHSCSTPRSSRLIGLFCRSGKRCISVDAWFIRALVRGRVVKPQLHRDAEWSQHWGKLD